MSDLITLSLARTQCELTESDTHYDELIELFIDAALDNVAMWIDKPLDGTGLEGTSGDPVIVDDTVDPPTLKLKPALISAALLIIGDLFANRESSITDIRVSINPTLERLMWPYRRMGV